MSDHDSLRSFSKSSTTAATTTATTTTPRPAAEAGRRCRPVRPAAAAPARDGRPATPAGRGDLPEQRLRQPRLAAAGQVMGRPAGDDVGNPEQSGTEPGGGAETVQKTETGSLMRTLCT